jgi:hypothetical protein
MVGSIRTAPQAPSELKTPNADSVANAYQPALDALAKQDGLAAGNDTWRKTAASPDRFLVVGVRHACSASSGVAMKRFLVAIGVVAVGLFAWIPTS